MNEELFERFSKNLCTPDEREKVLIWLETSDQKEEIEKKLEQHWNSIDFHNEINIDSEKIFSRVMNTLESKSLIPEKGKIVGLNSNHSFSYLTYAATIVLLIVVGLSVYYFNYEKLETVSNALNQRPGANAKPAIKEITLSDGTKVWLNAQSSIQFPKQFDDDSRVVNLEGEAFFEVIPNKSKPFIVKTSLLNIKVLGTSFNVKSFNDDENIEATLATGKIFIDLKEGSTKNENLYLNPSEGIVFSKKQNVLQKFENVDVASNIAWRDGLLVFKNTSFEEVEKKIERWFGIEIESTGIKSSDFSFTAKFDGESLKEVLDFMKLTLPMDFKVEGKKVFIVSR